MELTKSKRGAILAKMETTVSEKFFDPAFGLAFAWVIVCLLAPAVTPKLNHFGVVSDDEPCRDGEHWEAENRQHSKANEENRYAHKDNPHPSRQVESELGSWFVEGLIDR